MFSELQDALNLIWRTKPKKSDALWDALKTRFLSFILVIGTGVLLLASFLVNTFLAALGKFAIRAVPEPQVMLTFVNVAVSLPVTTLLFALMFKVLPDGYIAWRDVWLGAVGSGTLFIIGEWAIGLYIGSTAMASMYGAAASLMVILVWVYYSALIFFLGAEFTCVYANKYGSRVSHLKDSPYARRESNLKHMRCEVKTAHPTKRYARASINPTSLSCTPVMVRASLFNQRIVDSPYQNCGMLVVRGASRMTNQAIPATSLSGPPVSRWFGFFPEFQQDSLGFLLRCHSYGDVVKLPMGRMAEFLFRHPDLAMYFLNHPDDVKHVLVTNQHNYAKTQSPSRRIPCVWERRLAYGGRDPSPPTAAVSPLLPWKPCGLIRRSDYRKSSRPRHELARRRHCRHRT